MIVFEAKDGTGAARRAPNALRIARERAGLTRRQLAEAAGVSYGGLSELENGQRRPRRGTAAKIAGALGVKPEDLFDAFAVYPHLGGEGSFGRRRAGVYVDGPLRRYYSGESQVGRTCKLPGCEGDAKSYGLCPSHYHAARYGGELAHLLPDEAWWVRVRCHVDGCAGYAYAKDLCRNHYSAWYRTGDALHAEKKYEDASFPALAWHMRRRATSDGELADALGTTPVAVRNLRIGMFRRTNAGTGGALAKALGVTEAALRAEPPDHDPPLEVAGLRDPVTRKEAAAMLGVSRERVRQLVALHGLTEVRQGGTRYLERAQVAALALRPRGRRVWL